MENMDCVKTTIEKDFKVNSFKPNFQNKNNRKSDQWQRLGLDFPIYKGILKKGYRVPTPIQQKAIPSVLEGRDVVAMSRTGSGKTAAFVIPMLNKLKKRDPTGIRALLFSPTRELALQTYKFVKELGRFTGLRCECLVGGDNMDNQFAILHEHPDILVITPGRLLHLIVEMNLKLSSIYYLVFDEADRLFEMGFADQLNEILKRIPDSRQTLLFSATLPKMLIDFAKAGLNDPLLIRLDLDTKISEKLELVFATTREENKMSSLLSICRKIVNQQKRTIIFCSTMKHVEYISYALQAAGLENALLFSQLDPVARKMNIQKFREGKCYFLVVTDLAARGVDIPILDLAINFHFPSSPKLFIHRVGRVARAGRSGTSISLLAPDEIPYLIDLLLYLGKPIKFFEGLEYNNWRSEAMIGRFPEDDAYLETEFFLSLHENSVEMKDLQRKSENAMKKYLRTRPKSSSESVRRSKNEFRSIIPSIHPFFFDVFLNANENSQEKKIQCVELGSQMIQQIRVWRPNETIFELNKFGRHHTISSGSCIMKSKRKAHKKYCEKYCSDSGLKLSPIKSETKVENDDEKKVYDESQIVVISKFDSLEHDFNSKQHKKQRAQERRNLERQKFFLPYQPEDYKAETELAIKHNNFSDHANHCAIDINADDEKGLYREMNKRRWDRKLKKYTCRSENVVKKIRTEDGNWLPATYKTGRYETWKKQNKIPYQRNESEEFKEKTESSYPRHKILKRARREQTVDKNFVELKRPEQIIKLRKRKTNIQAYQSHRRQENIKKKSNNMTKSR